MPLYTYVATYRHELHRTAPAQQFQGFGDWIEELPATLAAKATKDMFADGILTVPPLVRTSARRQAADRNLGIRAGRARRITQPTARERDHWHPPGGASFLRFREVPVSGGG